jgi:hypothetical protein
VERLRRTIEAFFATEAAEADLRRALDDASALYRASPEAQAQAAKVSRLARAFFREALPRHAPAEVAFSADFFILALGAIAEKATALERDGAALARWTTATTDLLCAHLTRLQQPRRRKNRPPGA